MDFGRLLNLLRQLGFVTPGTGSEADNRISSIIETAKDKALAKLSEAGINTTLTPEDLTSLGEQYGLWLSDTDDCGLDELAEALFITAKSVSENLSYKEPFLSYFRTLLTYYGAYNENILLNSEPHRLLKILAHAVCDTTKIICETPSDKKEEILSDALDLIRIYSSQEDTAENAITCIKKAVCGTLKFIYEHNLTSGTIIKLIALYHEHSETKETSTSLWRSVKKTLSCKSYILPPSEEFSSGIHSLIITYAVFSNQAGSAGSLSNALCETLEAVSGKELTPQNLQCLIRKHAKLSDTPCSVENLGCVVSETLNYISNLEALNSTLEALDKIKKKLVKERKKMARHERRYLANKTSTDITASELCDTLIKELGNSE